MFVSRLAGPPHFGQSVFTPFIDCGPGCKLDVLLRPDDIVHDDASALQARIAAKAFRGAEFMYTLQLQSGTQVLCLAPSHHDHAIGSALGIRVEAEHLVMFPQSVPAV